MAPKRKKRYVPKEPPSPAFGEGQSNQALAGPTAATQASARPASPGAHPVSSSGSEPLGGSSPRGRGRGRGRERGPRGRGRGTVPRGRGRGSDAQAARPSEMQEASSSPASQPTTTSVPSVGRVPLPRPLRAAVSTSQSVSSTCQSTPSCELGRGPGGWGQGSRASAPDSNSPPQKAQGQHDHTSASPSLSQEAQDQQECTSASPPKKRKKKPKKVLDSPPPPPVLIPKTSSEVLDVPAEVRQFLNKSNAYCEGRVLLLDFDKLVATNKELAFTICNCKEQRRKVWLNQAAIDFFESNGLLAVDMNLPECVADAEDVLNSNTLVRTVKLFRGKEEADLPTAQGQILFDLILCGLLEDLVKGKTYCGGLTLKDLVFARYPSGKLKLLITKEPSIQENASNEDKALDVASVWPLLEKFYILERGALPLYFEELKTDLLTVTPDEIGQDWFIQYLKFHIALVSSMARRFLVTELYHNVRKFNINQWPEFYKFFYGEPMEYDWRITAQGHKALLITYDRKEKRWSGKEKSNKEKEGKQQDNENSQRGGESGILKEALQEGKAATECKQIERGGAAAESAKQGKQGLGKELSGNNKEGKQQGNVNSQKGGKCGILKETSREGKAATECKQADGQGAPESKGEVAVMEKVAPGSEMAKADVKVTAEEGQTQGNLAKVDPYHPLLTNKQHSLQHMDESIKIDDIDEDEYFSADEDEYFTAEEEFDKVEIYHNTRHSLLTYKRHSLQHIDESIKIDDLDEVEYFTARSFPKFLPRFIKGLLKISSMGGKLKRVWSLYKAAKWDGKDL